MQIQNLPSLTATKSVCYNFSKKKNLSITYFTALRRSPCEQFCSVAALSCLERDTQHEQQMPQEHRIVHNRLSIESSEDSIATSENKTPLKLIGTHSKYGMFGENLLDLSFVKRGVRVMWHQTREIELNKSLTVKNLRNICVHVHSGKKGIL